MTENEFWEQTTVTYTTYLKSEEGLFEINNGRLLETDFELDWYLEVIAVDLDLHQQS